MNWKIYIFALTLLYKVDIVSKKDIIVLITGASTGLGKVTASLLSKNGYTVFGTSRKLVNNKNDYNFEMLQLDVT